MARRTVSPDLIAALTEDTKTQKVGGSFSKTLDERFPVWSTPVDKEFIVYIPKGPTCKTVDGVSVFDPAVAHIHNAKSGNRFSTFRCMSNISPDLGEQLGYHNGECPVCNALAECYVKYNTMLKMKADEMGLDPKNEAHNDALRPIREQLRSEMAIQKVAKKYIFPIVVISETGIPPKTVEEAVMQPYFIELSESAFEKKLLKPLKDGLDAIENPAGIFFKFNYKYTPKDGQKPNARDAARELTITPLSGLDVPASLQIFVEKAEEVSKGFTAVQANTSVASIAYQYAEDVMKELEQLMAETRAYNASIAVAGGAPAALPTTAAPASSLNNALEAFASAPAQIGTAQATTAPAPTLGAFGAAPTNIDLNG